MTTWSSSCPRRKFSVDDVLGMLRAGVLRADERVELLEGDLFPVSPQHPRHAGAIRRLKTALARAYVQGFLVDIQAPLQLSENSLPEPDVMVLRGRDSSFDKQHPGARDCALVIEVSWSSELRDRQKAGLYAAAGVPTYWRLDVGARRLVVYEQPDASAGEYGSIRTLDEQSTAALPELADQTIQVADLLPPAEL